MLVAVGSASAETLTVAVDKSQPLRVGRAASVVVVGQPAIADVQVESPRLVMVLGRSVGETNLILLDNDGGEIATYDIVVVPSPDRQVTIFHGGDGVSTLSCNPRCAGVRNPGTDKEPGKGGAAAAAGGLGGAPSGGGAAPPGLPAGASGGASGQQQTSEGAGQPSLAPGATVEQGSGSSAGKRGY